jgi:tRNA/rRNA methyltransferase
MTYASSTLGSSWVENQESSLPIGTTARPGKSSRNVLRSTIDPTAVARRAISNKGKVAIVLGRDTTGLSNKELSLCDLTLTIPTNPEYPTMNVSHAAAVIFYELFKVCRKKNSKERIPDKKAMNRLMGFFNELVARSELPTHRRKLANRAFRNIISRSFITQRETSLLMGVFRKNLR